MKSPRKSRKFRVNIDGWGEVDTRTMTKHHFHGALGFNYASAERADITKQDFSVFPRHWYVDASFRCDGCGVEFTFTAKEQRFWYEDRHFYVDSVPGRCPECRKKDRRLKILKQQHDNLIAKALSSKELSTKEKVLGVLDELASVRFHIPYWRYRAWTVHLPEKMKENREILLKQIRKLKVGPSS